MRLRLALAILLVSCGERPLQAPPPHRAVPLPVLSFVEGAPVCVAAGSVHQFVLWDEWQRPALGLRIVWSMTPNDGHAALGEDGLLVVGDTAAEGAAYAITADVEGGARILKTSAMVFHPGVNPFLLSVWCETAEIGCDGVRRPLPYPEPMLRFFPDGELSCDRGTLPPDAHMSPSGRYAYDEAKKTITFTFPDRTMHGTYELTRAGPRHEEMGLHYQPSKLVLRGIPFNRTPHEPCARELRADSLVP